MPLQEKALSLNLQKSPDCKQALMDLMNVLESEKKSISLSQADRSIVCQQFAFSVFERADSQDRAGDANKETAQTFNTAALFFDVLEQFGPLTSEVIFVCLSGTTSSDSYRHCRF